LVVRIVTSNHISTEYINYNYNSSIIYVDYWLNEKYHIVMKLLNWTDKKTVRKSLLFVLKSYKLLFFFYFIASPWEIFIVVRVEKYFNETSNAIGSNNTTRLIGQNYLSSIDLLIYEIDVYWFFKCRKRTVFFLYKIQRFRESIRIESNHTILGFTGISGYFQPPFLINFYHRQIDLQNVCIIYSKK
jgi:hypothetical protein